MFVRVFGSCAFQSPLLFEHVALLFEHLTVEPFAMSVTFRPTFSSLLCIALHSTSDRVPTKLHHTAHHAAPSTSQQQQQTRWFGNSRNFGLCGRTKQQHQANATTTETKQWQWQWHWSSETGEGDFTGRSAAIPTCHGAAVCGGKAWRGTAKEEEGTAPASASVSEERRRSGVIRVTERQTD